MEDGGNRIIPFYAPNPGLQDLQNHFAFFHCVVEDWAGADDEDHRSWRPATVHIWLPRNEEDKNIEKVKCRLFFEADGETPWQVAYTVENIEGEREDIEKQEDSNEPDDMAVVGQ